MSYCFARDASTGRWSLVDDERALNGAELEPGRFLRIYTVDPSPRALAELLDRALDRPRRQEQEVKVSGELDVVHRLMAARGQHTATGRTSTGADHPSPRGSNAPSDVWMGMNVAARAVALRGSLLPIDYHARS